MATIEPRLMHLLNDSRTDLPPIQHSLARSSSHSLSLPALEPDTSLRSDKTAPTPKGQLLQQSTAFYATGDDIPIPIRQSSRRSGRDGSFTKDGSTRSSNSTHPLQLLLEDPQSNASHSSLHMILDDTPDPSEDLSNKKRHRALTVKDDFVQLPQPLKKQKSTQQVVPPIINGLHEPPPDAARFPPISSGTFDETDAANLNILKELGGAQEDRGGPSVLSEADRANLAKIKRKAAKPRRKWSEEETKHLLLGVSRHGVGKWTTILEDPDFKFDDRSAGDLKDRFRTCCPDELRGRTTSGQGKSSGMEKPDVTATEIKTPPKPKKGLHLENILIEPEEESPERETVPSTPQNDSDSAAKPRKTRAHRKKLEDLAELGIRGPFKKSHRRERRPFTDQDDKAILEGLDLYGPAWTKIQRDPRFSLSTRQPTDLRDRVRNKYPEIYARIEKGNFQIKDHPGRGSNLLEPSVNTTMENSLISTKSGGPLEPQLTRTSSREDMPKWTISSGLLEPSDSPVQGASSGFELMVTEQSASALLGGNVNEMDISRLLLDDSQIAGELTRLDGN